MFILGSREFLFLYCQICLGGMAFFGIKFNKQFHLSLYQLNDYFKNRCDGCQMFPINGPRFKCRNCDDFDFCEMCFKTRKHNTRHTFGRINEPGTVGWLQSSS